MMKSPTFPCPLDTTIHVQRLFPSNPASLWPSFRPCKSLSIPELSDPQALHGLYFMLLIHCGAVISAAYTLPCQALNRCPPYIQVYR